MSLQTETSPPGFTTDERRTWMGLLARSRPDSLANLLPEPLPEHQDLRAPEVGTMMVQGRTDASGAPFSLGEITVTRATLHLPCGTTGHALVQGRDRAHARRAALIDALMQTPEASRIRERILTPLTKAETDRRQARAAKAAATRVEFFTLVRGEDK
ncbi:phosphonate C-P lyase system protein PhnG [Xinfangfangia sp. D13-10-4-6]|uniref:phosphonate C-P lyase system protein PhnG n=1 Tax=Pseudogemmobacter hezensis TaxID=2737662 RepID=UPI0015524437|nr:phosphonate C-P lyase system protein PhnG [Pseudogemmobacter hezensis]NPD14100.1 phosphonate C-P lyase system protein PhnG [Pseudogemmobacter hezensis]